MADKKTYVKTSKELELHGKAFWPRVFPENMDKEGPDGAFESHGGAYTIDLVMDDENYDKLAATGSQLQPKEVDGYQKVKLKRKHIAPFNYGGPPQVAHLDGTSWDISEDGLIGNGSDVICYVEVYPVKGRIGTRLNGVQIVNLVKYESDEEFTPGGFKIPNRTGSEPKVKATIDKEEPEVKPKVTKKALIDDEIPF